METLQEAPSGLERHENIPNLLRLPPLLCLSELLSVERCLEQEILLHPSIEPGLYSFPSGRDRPPG